MSKRKQSRPVIDLTALGSIVRTSPNGKATFLDVTFRCDFGADAEPVEGISISIESRELLTVVQLAEASYLEIGKLLAKQKRDGSTLR